MKKYFLLFVFAALLFTSDLYSQYRGGSYDGYYSKLDTNIPYPVGIQNISEEVANFELFQNYPNPFNPSTNINFSLLKHSAATLKIFDITGKIVAVLIDNKEFNPGKYNVTFDSRSASSRGITLSSGIYFYKLTVSEANSNGAVDFTDTKKMILAK